MAGRPPIAAGATWSGSPFVKFVNVFEPPSIQREPSLIVADTQVSRRDQHRRGVLWLTLGIYAVACVIEDISATGTTADEGCLRGSKQQQVRSCCNAGKTP